MNTITDKLATALRNCLKLAYNCHRDELPTAIIMTASKAIAEYEDARAEEYPQKAVAWARPVYAKPVGAPEEVKGEMVDVEFHNRPEKPEGEGWHPLVVAAPQQPSVKPEVTCAVCEELVERIGNGYVPNGSREEQVSLREAALERLTAAKSQTERTTQVDDDAGKDFFVVVAAFVLIVLGTVFLLFLK